MLARYKSLFLVISICLIAGSLPADLIAPGLTGQDLFDYLVDNYKTSTTLGYDQARDKMYGEIDLQPGNHLVCVYSGYSITISNLSNPRPEVTAQNMNCEHTWPQSLGSENEPMRSDIHHLYPTHEDVNISRGNSPYAEIADQETDIWWYNGNPYYSIPSSEIDLYSEKQENTPARFEIREDHKGNSARSIFYFYTIYNNVADENFFQVQKYALKLWHDQDPVDQEEIDRTWAIAAYQQDIPNPFVIDSTLVRRIWFQDDIPPAYDLVINEIHYNPAPAQGPDSDFEFLELFSREDEQINLAGYSFSSGIDHVFDELILDPGQYLILAKNSSTYPGSIEWDGGFLNNTGETLLLVSPNGMMSDSVSFGISSPWPVHPNGDGPSLELISTELENSLGSNWAASLNQGGTPGLENSVSNPEPQIQVINPNGGETWIQSSSHNITWISQNLAGNLKIELYMGDMLQEVLTNETENDGSWQWNIPTNQTEGDDYVIRVTALEEESLYDESDGYFTITAGASGGAEDLFFSEYIEGTSNNKAVEIFNGTGYEVDLENYQIWRANNGNVWDDGYVFPLQGQITSGDVWVVCNTDADPLIQAVADSSGGGITWFNGNDVLGLAKTDNGRDWNLIDIIGVVGEDPGAGWDVAGFSTATQEHTLVRKANVLEGNLDWLESAGTNPENSEWIVYPLDDFSHLGSHDFAPSLPPDQPVNLTIYILSGVYYLSWSPVEGADHYNIYSSSSPLDKRDWIYLATVSDTNWNGTVTEQKKFFRVTAEN